MSSAPRWALLALAMVPLAAATHQGPSDLNAVDLNVLVYHPYPDENGDPWGIPAVTVNGSEVDWMQGTYGAFFYPTAVFDGLIRIDEMTQGEGGGQFQETNATYHGAMEALRGRDAPATISIQARVQDRELTANVTVTADASFPNQGLLLRIVYVEDDVTFNGGSGVLHHRFVVRGEEQVVEPAVDMEGYRGEASFMLTEIVDPANVGVVVVLQNFDEASAVFEHKEVLQAATWTARQQGPTTQSARGVLLELYSATWCTACVVGDAVADNMANTYGVQSSRVVDTSFEYLRPGELWKVGLAAVGASAIVAWLRRRREPPVRP